MVGAGLLMRPREARVQTSVWVGWQLVALMGATGLYCLARLLLRPDPPRGERQLDASEALKGLGMAAMAVPYGIGRTVPAPVWLGVFAAAAMWSLAEAARSAEHRGHHLYHGVGHMAMVYMAVVMADPMAAMAGMNPGLTWVTGALLLFFGGYSLVAGVRLIGASAAEGAGAGTGSRAVAGLLWAPELPRACRIVLGLGMLTMLLAM
jgi:hypothetical protein